MRDVGACHWREEDGSGKLTVSVRYHEGHTDFGSGQTAGSPWKLFRGAWVFFAHSFAHAPV